MSMQTIKERCGCEWGEGVRFPCAKHAPGPHRIRVRSSYRRPTPQVAFARLCAAELTRIAEQLFAAGPCEGVHRLQMQAWDMINGGYSVAIRVSTDKQLPTVDATHELWVQCMKHPAWHEKPGPVKEHAP